MKEPSAEPRETVDAGTSRRDFLSRTAALAGMSALLGPLAEGGTARKVFPKAKPRAPLGADEPIRMGLIGAGGMGDGHLVATMTQAEEEKEKVQVVAVCDVAKKKRDEKAQACSDRQGIEVASYLDYHELLAREDVHAVLIATPEHWHAQMAIDAMLAGKDVYMEKPMTLRLPEALELYHFKQANPEPICQVGTQKIAQNKYLEARRLIAEGAIGKPVFSQTSYCRNSLDGEWLYYGIDPEIVPGEALDWQRWCGPLGLIDWNPALYARWRRYREYSTGIIGDLLVHVITPLVMALDHGWPTRVVASGGHYVDKAMENHDQVNINIEFEKEHTMVVAGSTCNEKGLETMVRGHEATLYLGGKDLELKPERHWVDDIDPLTIECAAIQDQNELRLDWFSCIRTRGKNLSPVELGTKIMVIVDLATRSMWTGKAFAFDPVKLRARAI